MHPGAVGDPDDVDAAGRVGEVAAGGVDDDEDELGDGGHRGELVVGVAELGQRKRAQANGIGGVADVDEADALAGGVGVDDGVAVGGDGRDLGDGIGVDRIGGGRFRYTG